MRRAGVEINPVTSLNDMRLITVANLQLALQHEQEFVAGMDVRPHFGLTLERHKFRIVRVEMAVRNHVPQALEEIGRVVDAGLRQTYALVLLVDTKRVCGSGSKK
jgi:hypothetical protein